MAADRSDVLAGARLAVEAALTRSRRLGAGLVAAGLATAFLAAPVAGQVVDDTTEPPADDPSAGDPEAGTDPFDAGSEPVAEEQVTGDDTTTTTAPTPAPAPAVVESPDTAFATEAVEANGDGVVDAKDDANAADTGSLALVDGIGVEWFINTDITFATTSSASAAASEASFTTAHAGISTTNGTATYSTTLTDGFDGYNSLCLDLGADGGGVDCSTDDSDFVIYNGLGAAPTLECSGREAVFPTLTNVEEAGIDVVRKVFVPANDSFARWQNIITNTGASPETVRVQTANNLGSDGSTIVFGSSSGDAAASTADTWVGTFDDFSGDPRLAHVLGGPGAPVGRSLTTFVNGDDNPFWAYDVTIAPGQTVIIINYATAQLTQAAATAKASELAAGTNPNQYACMTDAARAQVVNFVAVQQPPPTTTTTTTATTAPPATTTTTAVAAPLARTGPGQVAGFLQAAGAAMAAGGGALAGSAALRNRLRWRRARHRGGT
jgi:hypothetical protein